MPFDATAACKSHQDLISTWMLPGYRGDCKPIWLPSRTNTTPQHLDDKPVRYDPLKLEMVVDLLAARRPRGPDFCCSILFCKSLHHNSQHLAISLSWQIIFSYGDLSLPQTLHILEACILCSTSCRPHPILLLSLFTS